MPDFPPGESGIWSGLTIGGAFRAVERRWLWVFLFLGIGTAVAVLLMMTLPRSYRATASFTMNLRSPAPNADSPWVVQAATAGASYVELFNTRLYRWRSPEFLADFIRSYHARFTTSTVTDEALVEAFANAEIELQKRSRRIDVSVWTGDPRLSADLANLYVREIAEKAESEDKRTFEESVAGVRASVRRQRDHVAALAAEWVSFRTTNSIDVMETKLELASLGARQNAEVLAAVEVDEAKLAASEKLMKDVYDNPELYGTLSAGDPRAADIATELKAYQDAESECRRLLSAYTRRHPGVRLSGKAVLIARSRLRETVKRALDSGRSALKEIRARKAALTERRDEYEAKRQELESQLAQAEGSGKRLDAELATARRLLSELQVAESKVMTESERNKAPVVPGLEAQPPTDLSFPDWRLVYGISLAVALLGGIVFAVLLDRTVDLVMGIADIEERVGLRVLAVLPHLPYRHRQNVARTLMESDQAHSPFSESVLGLRNLLGSGCYGAGGRCLMVVSTQPGEGKTITATSLAISFAQSGLRTLLVDFDLRRPQQRGIWNLQLDREHSFSHVLGDVDGTAPDFSSLVNPTPVRGLDVIGSLEPDGVYPANIFGSPVIRAFFAWAKVVYDCVVVDAPPFGVVGDVVALATQVDSVLLMCRPDRTSCAAMCNCVNYLRETGANVLGVVVNDADISVGSRFARTELGHYGLAIAKGSMESFDELDQASRYADD